MTTCYDLLGEGSNTRVYFFIVEFATIQLVNDKVKYDLYKPEQIDALLKEQNVGAAATSTETATA